MALLLFGAIFLFKYSVDQGWLNPTIRIFFGLALGAGLSVIGLRRYHKRKHFSQVLLGGSIATFYITGYAAFQLFHLIPYPAAFSLYVAITLYSFFLALKLDEFIFSIIAIAGGLGTPFLLYTGAGSVPGLMLYLCILLTGASAIYFYKGWWSFFWTTCLGGWTVIWIAMFGEKSLTYAPTLDKVSIEAALFLALPFFWLIPLAREIALVKMPELVKSLAASLKENVTGVYQPNLPEINVNLLTILTPFGSLFMSALVWDWEDATSGVATIIMALVMAAGGWWLNFRMNFKSYAYTHSLAALIFLTVSIYFFFDGDVLLFTLAMLAAAVHLIKIKIGEKTLAPLAHILFGLIGCWVLFRLLDSSAGLAVLNETALADICVIFITAGMGFLLEGANEKRAYLLAAHAALLLWFLRELSPLINGQGIVSVAWGIYTIALFVIGLRKNLSIVTKTAMVTLLILVGKLFLVDLANLETIWRILLFLGFGAVLLFLSYYFQSLWKNKKG